MKALINIGLSAITLFAGLSQASAQNSNNTIRICPTSPVVLKASVPQNIDASGGFIWYKDGVMVGAAASASDSVIVATEGNYSLVSVSAQGCQSQVSLPIGVAFKEIVAHNDSYNVMNGASTQMEVTINDMSGCDALDPTTIDIVAQATNGLVFVNNDGSLLFIPNPGFVGTDSFRYTVKDIQNNTSNVAVVYLNADNSAPLSVKVLSFEATKKGANAALINWSLQSDGNQYGYTLERSVDGKSFTTISTLNASFNNEVFRSSYLDEQPITGRNFYRLKIEDETGNATYSSVKMINFDVIKATEIFPNPTKGTFVVATPNEVPSKIQVVDVQGRVINKVNPHSTETKFDISGFAAGTYFVKIVSASGKTENLKVQKH